MSNAKTKELVTALDHAALHPGCPKEVAHVMARAVVRLESEQKIYFLVGDEGEISLCFGNTTVRVADNLDEFRKLPAYINSMIEEIEVNYGF